MLTDRKIVRAELGEMVAKAMAAGGPEFSQAPIVSHFSGRGIGRSTLYRWITDAMEEAAAQIAVAAREESGVAPEVEALNEPGAGGAVATRGIVAQADLDATAILHALHDNMEASRQVMAHSRKDDGSVRNAKLLMVASENLRRGIETASRIFEAVHSVQRVEAFHRMILEEIAAESPTCAKRIWDRLEQAGRHGIA